MKVNILFPFLGDYEFVTLKEQDILWISFAKDDAIVDALLDDEEWEDIKFMRQGQWYKIELSYESPGLLNIYSTGETDDANEHLVAEKVPFLVTSITKGDKEYYNLNW